MAPAMPGPQKRAFRLFTCLLRSIRLYEAGDSLFKFADLAPLFAGSLGETSDGRAGTPELADDGENRKTESLVFKGATDNVFFHSHT
jgi:hypothetical protein